LWLIQLQLLTTLDALIERDKGMFDGSLIAKHVRVFEEHLAGVRINLHIGHQLRGGSLRFQLLHERFDLRIFSLIFVSSSGLAWTGGAFALPLPPPRAAGV
jgi:hypothetical protein